MKIKYKVLDNLENYLLENPLPESLTKHLNGLDYLIYGGFVRDLIAKHHNKNFKEGFKDIDIILLPDYFNNLLKSLKKEGYELSGDDQATKVYKHWGAVSHIYDMVPEKGPRIQLVSPNPFGHGLSKEKLRDVLLEPVYATDIRCCAVAISPNNKLLEVLPGAFNDCKEMVLKESPLASHKVNLKERMEKLKSRGWRSI